MVIIGIETSRKRDIGKSEGKVMNFKNKAVEVKRSWPEF